MKIYQVDAFTNQPFAGNPAAVCILTEQRDEKWMQNVAKEMNLSETAFLYKQEDGYNLRWFTPAVEVDLCGHATLASAHILWGKGYLDKNTTARFHTRSGLLTAEINGDWIQLNFPVQEEKETEYSVELIKGIGIKPKYVGKSRINYYIAEVESEEIVRNLKPDFSSLLKVPFHGLIVTSVSSSKEYDFVSRFFAPALGVDEDPVTGSAHCTLGPFWQKRLNKDKFIAYQASSRGGIVKVQVCNDRVLLGGQAVTVLDGELLN